MKPYSYLTATFVMAYFIPIPGANATTTTITITCDNSGNGGSTYDSRSCTSPYRTTNFTTTSGAIDCVCPSDSTKLITYTCYTNYREGDSTDDRTEVDEAWWNASSCFSKTCATGEYLYGYYSCRACTTYTGDTNATSNANAASINECYIPAGTTYTDTTGIFAYTDACYYSGTDTDDSDTGTTESSSSSA